jgi:prophage regulatory protein
VVRLMPSIAFMERSSTRAASELPSQRSANGSNWMDGKSTPANNSFGLLSKVKSRRGLRSTVESSQLPKLKMQTSASHSQANCTACGHPLLPNDRQKIMASLPARGYVRQKLLIPHLVPFSSATLWRKVSDGTFPAPHKLSARVTAWKIEEVKTWIAVNEQAPGRTYRRSAQQQKGQ